jgi:hypothetical protein
MRNGGANVPAAQSGLQAATKWVVEMKPFGLAISLAICGSSLAYADSYREATEHAYCVGVYQSDIETTKSGAFGNTPRALDTYDLELKRFRAQAFVEGAIKQQQIDSATASKMQSVGYADGNLCWQENFRCIHESAERWKTSDDRELNRKQFEHCNDGAQVICKRVFNQCK